MDRNPSARLAERAIRKAQLADAGGPQPFFGGARSEVRRLSHSQPGDVSAVFLGLLAGFLGALVSLAGNVVGAVAFGIEGLKLLRVYATIIEGSAALDPERTGFFAAVFSIHIAAGAVFGVTFTLLARKYCCAGLPRYVSLSVAYGAGIWLLNYYGVLSWLQPLIWGESIIINEIPVWVAFLTHAAYGMTVAFVTFPFQRDLRIRR